MATVSFEDFMNEPSPEDHSPVEQKYGLPKGILADIRDKGERSGPQAVSPKGAQGRFQLMPEVQKAYGVTNPSSESQSADAAGKLLRDTYTQYRKEYPGISDEQAWNAVTAHYNGGYAAGRAVAQGKAPPAKETQDYLSRVSEATFDEFMNEPGAGSASAEAGPAVETVPGSTASRFNVPADSTLLARKNVPPKSQLERSPSGLFEPGSRSEALAQGFSSGSTLGLGPLAAPYIRGILPGGVDSTLDERRLQQAQIQARAESQHPGATFAGSLLGGLPMAAATGGGGNTLLAKAWQAGRAGAIQGGVSGAAHEALDPNATAGDVLLGGGLGATLGGTIGAAVPAVGAGIKAGLNKVGGSKWGQGLLGKYSDMNPVTGQPIQASLSELLADKTGLGALTPAGRERLVKAKLAEEYTHSAPTVRAKYFDVDEVGKEGGRGSGWKTGTVKRYDSEGKLIQDQLYREARNIYDGKVIFGEPVKNATAVEMATVAPPDPVYNGAGELLGFVDPTAVGSSWFGQGEIRGPVSDALAASRPTRDLLIDTRKRLGFINSLPPELRNLPKVSGVEGDFRALEKLASENAEPEDLLRGISAGEARSILRKNDIWEAPIDESSPEVTRYMKENLADLGKAAHGAMRGQQLDTLKNAVKHAVIDAGVQGGIGLAEYFDMISGNTASAARGAAFFAHSKATLGAVKDFLAKNAPQLLKMYGFDLASKDPAIVTRAIRDISAALKPTAQAAVRAAPTKTDADYQALLGQQLGQSSRFVR